MKGILALFVLGFAVLIEPAVAGPRQDVMNASRRCAAITNDRQWLDCYYGAAQPMRAQLGLSPAPLFQQRLVPGAAAARVAPPPKTAATFGHARHGSWRWLHLRAYSFDKNGMFTVTLSDGSVWRQRQDDVNYAHWTKPPSDYIVSLGGGLLGSATMEMRDDGKQYLVRRVR